MAWDGGDSPDEVWEFVYRTHVRLLEAMRLMLEDASPTHAHAPALLDLTS